MLARLLRSFSDDLAIDLGTENTRIAAAGRGVIVSEPSVAAVDLSTRRISARGLAVGHLAKQIEGRTPADIDVRHPVREGVIADFQLCEAMLRTLLAKTRRSRLHLPPRAVVGLTEVATEVERRAVFNSVARAGARQVFGWSKAMAAALGAGLPVAEPTASAICDIGAGTAEIAVVSLGRVVVARAVRLGGHAFDQALCEHLRRHRRLRVGLPTVEQLRIAHGAAQSDDDDARAEVAGVDAATGLPRSLAISRAEIALALADPLQKLADAVREVVENLNIELAADLTRLGLTLSGGAAQLAQLDRFLSDQLGIPVRLAVEPDNAVIRGLLTCAEHLDAWKSALVSVHDERIA